MLGHRSLRHILAVRFAAALVLTLTLGACSSAAEGEGGPDDTASSVDADPPDDDGGLDDDEEAPPETDEDPGSATDVTDDDDDDPPSEPAVDPAEVGADELGVIPVLMYHQLRDGGGSDWDMSAEEFRAELVRLFDSGYVPITVIDLVRGEIDVPAGHHPVVLTFDDSTRSQARLEEDGQIAADTSIGILIDVSADYDHIEPVASLYVISNSLFGGSADGPDVLAALHEAGMEIGNHSHTHANLRSLDAAGVQEELATNVATVREIVGDAEVATLSLPLGIYPTDAQLAVRGSANGVEYHNEAVLQVGYTPAQSPFHADFDGASVARIQTHPDPDFEFGSAWWLDQLDAAQSWRPYVADGDPTTISFPKERADELDPASADRANPY